jgi:hypothetical protein
VCRSIKPLGFDLLSVSQLLHEGLEVRSKTCASRVLDSRGDLVYAIVPKGQILKVDFLSLLALFFGLLRVFRQSFGNGIGGWVT